MAKQLLRYAARGRRRQRQAPDELCTHTGREQDTHAPRALERLPSLGLHGERTSPDAEYWLSRCHGFLVDTISGEEVGVVDDVEIDERSGRASAIEISAGWFGRRRFTISADSVQRVLPAERRLYIDRPEPSDSAPPPALSRPQPAP